jgi:hypothetical protein
MCKLYGALGVPSQKNFLILKLGNLQVKCRFRKSYLGGVWWPDAWPLTVLKLKKGSSPYMPVLAQPPDKFHDSGMDEFC